MTRYYLLSACRLHHLRWSCKKLAASIGRRSSCYHWQQRYYLLIQTAALLSHQICLQLNQDEVEVQPIPTDIPVASSAIQLLTRWAVSEIEQNVEFIHWEQQALPLTYTNTRSEKLISGCYLTWQQQRLIRSYLPLTETMLVINQTPDSFAQTEPQTLEQTLLSIEHALQHQVAIIDLGAESTRPGASIISVQEEIARLTPLINAVVELKPHYQFKLSLDSYKPETIQHFWRHLDIINDVSGSLAPRLIQEIAASGKSYLAMHSLTVPANKEVNLDLSCNPRLVIWEWWEQKLEQLQSCGLASTQIILDLGIGFNKTCAQSWYLLRQIQQFITSTAETLIGHSRKSFLNQVTLRPYAERDLETAAISCYLAQQQVDYVRIHTFDEYLRLAAVHNNLGLTTLAQELIHA